MVGLTDSYLYLSCCFFIQSGDHTHNIFALIQFWNPLAGQIGRPYSTHGPPCCDHCPTWWISIWPYFSASIVNLNIYLNFRSHLQIQWLKCNPKPRRGLFLNSHWLGFFSVPTFNIPTDDLSVDQTGIWDTVHHTETFVLDLFPSPWWCRLIMRQLLCTWTRFLNLRTK